MKNASFAADEAVVRDKFWCKLLPLLGSIPFAEDLVAAFYCAFDPQTPTKVKATLFGALAYFILPFDVVPDILPFLGFGDDAAVLATAIATVRASITHDHRRAAKRALASPPLDANGRFDQEFA